MRWHVLLFVASALTTFGIVSVVNQSFTRTNSFSLPPRYYDYYSIYMFGAGRISGHFSESQGQPVTFYVFDQQEFDNYKASGGAAFILSIANVPSGTYQVDIESGGRYYLVTISESDQTTEQVTNHFTVTESNLAYTGLESLAIAGPILLIVSARLRVKENRRIISSILKANPNYGPGQGEADDRIFSSAKNFCRQLGLGYEPLRLSWIAWIRLIGVRVAPSDFPLMGVKGKARGGVFMPVTLRGKLEPNEWAPLIASSLIYSFNPSIRRKWLLRKRLWLLMYVGFVAILPIFFFLLYAFPPNGSLEDILLDALVTLLLFSGSLIVIFSGRKINMINRNYFLEADRIAAQITGREQMLQILKKIDEMKLSDVEDRKKEKPTIWRRAGVLPFPSITLRIQQLVTEKP